MVNNNVFMPVSLFHFFSFFPSCLTEFCNLRNYLWRKREVDVDVYIIIWGRTTTSDNTQENKERKERGGDRFSAMKSKYVCIIVEFR